MAGLRVESGNSTAGLVNVDSAFQLKVVTESDVGTNPQNVGAVRMFCENDPGTVTGTPYLKSPEVSEDYRLRVGIDTLLFTDEFNSTVQNSNIWKFITSASALAVAGASGSVTFNSTSVVTASKGAALQTWRYFPLYGAAPLYIEFIGSITASPLANQNWCAGLGVPVNDATEPTDGVYFRLNNGGLFGVLKYNGTESMTGQLMAAGAIPLNTNARYVITATYRNIEFWIDDVLMAEIATPNAQSMPYMSATLPIFMQFYNSGTISGSPHMMVKMGTVSASLGDLATNMPWREQMSSMGMNGMCAQNGINMNTAGLAQTAVYPNGTNPTTALPVNTALTANLPAGLGGQGLATMWVLAATDMVMMQYLNQLGSVNQSPMMLKIKGVKISAATFAATWVVPAAGTYLFQWGLMVGGTTATAATLVDTASFTIGTTTVKGGRRRPLGLMAFPTAASPVGAMGNDITVNWDVPITVNPGEYVTVLCKALNAGATAAGGMYFIVDFDAFWE